MHLFHLRALWAFMIRRISKLIKFFLRWKVLSEMVVYFTLETWHLSLVKAVSFLIKELGKAVCLRMRTLLCSRSSWCFGKFFLYIYIVLRYAVFRFLYFTGAYRADWLLFCCSTSLASYCCMHQDWTTPNGTACDWACREQADEGQLAWVLWWKTGEVHWETGAEVPDLVHRWLVGAEDVAWWSITHGNDSTRGSQADENPPQEISFVDMLMMHWSEWPTSESLIHVILGINPHDNVL